MQEDNFLQDYKQVWQQDNEAMERLVDIPLETLHENIARYEQRKRTRRIVWMTVSAAACLAFAVTTGIRYLTPESGNDNQTLVAENRTARPITYPATTWHPSQEGTAGAPTAYARTSHKTNHNVATAHRSTDDEITATSTPTVAEVVVMDVPPINNEPDEIIVPAIDANVIETTRLVAMGETTAPVIEVETDGLVKIIEPSRNTFREAIVEPLLALATYDM